MPGIVEIDGKYYDFRDHGINVNPSFLLTAKELKTLGIKNYYFMLRIDNPRVAEIDPFKPNITKQEVDALIREFRRNMWSFMRMAVRMRTTAGIVPYGLHRGLAAAAWCYERNQDHCLCEPRQTWKTTGIIAGPLQWTYQMSRNTKMLFFGKETDNTKRNLASLKDDISLLPEWLQFRRFLMDGKVKKARESLTTFENTFTHNSVIIHPKPTSPSHAEGLARGDSGPVMYFDELEHTPFIPILLTNSSPAFKTASDNAKLVGGVTCRTMSCTPGNLDTRIGKESYPIIKSMIPWSEKIYDMTPQQIEEYKSAFREDYHNNPEGHDREVIDTFYIEYQYYQVRKTYKWVQEQYALSGDKMGIRREILLQRLRGSTESPISPEDIEYLISNMKKSTNDIIINNKWRFLLYDHGQGYLYGKLKDLDETIPYIVGIDPAGGGGGDNFAVTVINPYNLKIAAEFKSPYISGPDAVRMLVSLVQDYIPKAVLIPERNNMGIYLIQWICEQTSIKDNLYWNKTLNELEDMVTDDPKDSELKKLSAQYKKYGHWTGKNRGAMFELLFLHIAQCKDILLTEYLVDDICKLVRTSTGRIEAVKGEHDDCLMSYLIGIYTFYTGDNLLAFGIDKDSYDPIIAPIEADLDKKLIESDPMNGFFSTENVKTYNDLVMETAAIEEEKIKELTSRFSWIRDDVYSKSSNRNDDENNSTINPYFFDAINGLI